MEVYLIYLKELDVYKIGVSKNSKKRMKTLQTGSPYDLELKGVFCTEFAYKIEKSLHRHFVRYKKDENFDDLKGEWFQIPLDEVKHFKDKCRFIEEMLIALKKQNNPFV